ncbi:MAG: nucleotidyltransferase family protein [Gammaproteobacteria bacterium]|nr:nucleotidyltransferase family protein [Gammaproteobacteria bacterium]
MARRRSRNVTCVILAAGGSSRLGTAKQLVRHRGRALLRRAADAAVQATARPPIVVVGAEALRLRALLRRSHGGRVAVVANARWREGLSTSVVKGLRAVPRDADAVLFVLTDQPLVGAAALERLLQAWSRQPSRPAAARYSGRVGVPAVIPRRLWSGLDGLRGDTGARRLLGGSPRLTVVDMPEAAFDVDRPEDLARLERGAPRGADGLAEARRAADEGRGERSATSET